MKINKIAVIGGAGKSGKYVVNKLLQTRFSLRLLLRTPQKSLFNHPDIEILQGDVREYKTVLNLLTGCEAVISTLGQPKNEPSIFSQATRNILNAMLECGIKRYIVTTGLNVDTPFDKKDERVRNATRWMYDNFPETTKDKQLEYEILSASKTDWTLVRLPLINQSVETLPLHIDLTNCPGSSVSSSDLAGFLVSLLTDKSFIHKSPFLSN